MFAQADRMMTVYSQGVNQSGPGKPDLLPLRAANAIQLADGVSFYALIDPAILDLARPGARLNDIGKRCGRHAMNQAAINRLIATLAQMELSSDCGIC